MKLAVVLLIVGAALIAYAFTLPAYTDEALFTQRYAELPSGQTEAFWKLKDEMLTPKFELQDYGGICIVAAAVVFLVARRGWRQFEAAPRAVRCSDWLWRLHA